VWDQGDAYETVSGVSGFPICGLTLLGLENREKINPYEKKSQVPNEHFVCNLQKIGNPNFLFRKGLPKRRFRELFQKLGFRGSRFLTHVYIELELGM